MEQIIEVKKTSLLRKISFTIIGILVGCYGLFGFVLGCIGGCYSNLKITSFFVGGASSLVYLFSMIILSYKKSKNLAWIALISLVTIIFLVILTMIDYSYFDYYPGYHP